MPTDSERAAACLLAWPEMLLHPDPEIREVSSACVECQLRLVRSMVRKHVAHARLSWYKWRHGY